MDVDQKIQCLQSVWESYAIWNCVFFKRISGKTAKKILLPCPTRRGGQIKPGRDRLRTFSKPSATYRKVLHPLQVRLGSSAAVALLSGKWRKLLLWKMIWEQNLIRRPAKRNSKRFSFVRSYFSLEMANAMSKMCNWFSKFKLIDAIFVSNRFVFVPKCMRDKACTDRFTEWLHYSTWYASRKALWNTLWRGRMIEINRCLRDFLLGSFVWHSCLELFYRSWVPS